MMKVFLNVLFLYMAMNCATASDTPKKISKTKKVVKEKQVTKSVIGKSKKWTVLRANPKSNNVCYAILYVNKHKGNQKVEKEKPYIMVHYFSEGRTRFSIYFGYTLLKNKPIHLSIDSKQYKLSPLNEYAVSNTSLQDKQIIDQLKTSNNLLIRGEGKHYAYSIDLYDTVGFAKAFDIMQSHCNSSKEYSSFNTIVPSEQHLKKIIKPKMIKPKKRHVDTP